MIYIDPPQQRFIRFRNEMLPSSHLVSDTSEDELHAFVAAMGLSRRGFHNKPGKPHYDLIDWMIPKAIEMGAKQVTSREIVRILHRRFGDGSATT
jgi:hypothetical protein